MTNNLLRGNLPVEVVPEKMAEKLHETLELLNTWLDADVYQLRDLKNQLLQEGRPLGPYDAMVYKSNQLRKLINGLLVWSGVDPKARSLVPYITPELMALPHYNDPTPENINPIVVLDQPILNIANNPYRRATEKLLAKNIKTADEDFNHIVDDIMSSIHDTLNTRIEPKEPEYPLTQSLQHMNDASNDLGVDGEESTDVSPDDEARAAREDQQRANHDALSPEMKELTDQIIANMSSAFAVSSAAEILDHSDEGVNLDEVVPEYYVESDDSVNFNLTDTPHEESLSYQDGYKKEDVSEIDESVAPKTQDDYD